MTTELSSEIEINEIIKRGRGRPKKEKVPTEPKKIGRPRKEIIITEIREKIKPGPKTSKTTDPEYYNNYYREHYKGVYTTCPSCKNPHVSIDKVHRHMRSMKCWKDEIHCKYIKTEDSI
jgi:hypothetical protein